jgi:hypothetical protein
MSHSPGGDSSLPGLPLDAELELSLEDEMAGVGLSLQSEMTASSARAPPPQRVVVQRAPVPEPPPPVVVTVVDTAALDRLEKERAELQVR